RPQATQHPGRVSPLRRRRPRPREAQEPAGCVSEDGCVFGQVPEMSRMKYAICNETFEGWDHARVCRFIAELGYTGLEMAPFTLAPRITDVSLDRRRQLRREAEEAGIQIIGLHWLLAKTEGLQVTAPDEATRQRTAEYLVELARCCADFGGTLMIFGSPGQ